MLRAEDLFEGAIVYLAGHELEADGTLHKQTKMHKIRPFICAGRSDNFCVFFPITTSSQQGVGMNIHPSWILDGEFLTEGRPCNTWELYSLVSGPVAAFLKASWPHDGVIPRLTEEGLRYVHTFLAQQLVSGPPKQSARPAKAHRTLRPEDVVEGSVFFLSGDTLHNDPDVEKKCWLQKNRPFICLRRVRHYAVFAPTTTTETNDTATKTRRDSVLTVPGEWFPNCPTLSSRSTTTWDRESLVVGPVTSFIAASEPNRIGARARVSDEGMREIRRFFGEALEDVVGRI